MKNPLGIQSYCFRGFKENTDVIEKLKSCGVSAIELCRVHVDFFDQANAEKVIQLYRNAGIQIASIGVEGLQGDIENERKLFEFARKAGAKVISVTFPPHSVPDSWRSSEKLADEYDIKLAIHNHGGRHWLGSAEILRHVFKNTSDRIGLCLDTAWALDSGEDPLQMVEEFGDRLYGLHIKDFVFDQSRTPSDVVVGTGNLDLPGLAEKLDATDFDGSAVLEYEGDVNNPVPALIDCVKAVESSFNLEKAHV